MEQFLHRLLSHFPSLLWCYNNKNCTAKSCDLSQWALRSSSWCDLEHLKWIHELGDMTKLAWATRTTIEWREVGTGNNNQQSWIHYDKWNFHYISTETDCVTSNSIPSFAIFIFQYFHITEISFCYTFRLVSTDVFRLATSNYAQYIQ